MARLFDDANTEGLRNASFPALAEPFSLFCRFKTDTNAPNQQSLVSVGDADGTIYYVLALEGTTDDVFAMAYDGDATAKVNCTSNHSLNTWQVASCSFTGDDSIAVYMDGGNKGTYGPTGHGAIDADAVAIGVSADSTPYGYASAAIAEVAIWNIELSDAEHALLAKGYSPLFVRPEALVFYAPLIRGEIEKIGGLALTAQINAPDIDIHPPIIYPAPPFLSFPVAVGGEDITVPVKTLTEATFAPTVDNPFAVAVPVKTLSEATFAPTVQVTQLIVPPVKTLTEATFVPGVDNPWDVTVPVKTLSEATFTPEVDIPSVIKDGGDDLVIEKPYEYQKEFLDIEPVAREDPLFDMRMRQRSVRDANQVAEQLARQNEEAAAERVSQMLATEKSNKDKADRRRAASLINLAKAQLAKEAKAAKKAEDDKVRKKNLQKARRKLKRQRAKKKK